MTSVQERLQLKRVPLDKWSIREQLCLASAVVASGDQNWMSVSRAVKMLCGTDRPSDWFSQKSCAAQYGKLLENVETPKRKKRTEKDNGQTPVETPGESIVRKLLQERTDELNQLIQDDRQEYLKIKDEILLVQSGTATDAQLEEMWAQIEMEKKQREKEQQQHAQWLKEREERKIEMERAWRPMTNIMSPSHSPLKVPPLNIKIKTEDCDTDEFSSSKQGTSPLLTSLLKSPSPAPNPCSTVLHPSINSSSSTRVSAPTITNLLTGTIPNISASSSTPTTAPFSMHIQKQSALSTASQSHDQILSNTVSPSKAAPTLSMLLECKKDVTQKIPPLVRIDQPQQPSSIRHHSSDVTRIEQPPIDSIKTEPVPSDTEMKQESVESPLKEDDQHLMEVFNGLIPDNIDELADILTENNAIILNPELLEEESILENVESLINEENRRNKCETVQLNESATIAGASTSCNQIEKPMPADCDDTKDFHDAMNNSKDAMKQENPSQFSPNQSDSIVLIRDDENSDISNDIPLAKLIPPKTDSSNVKQMEQNIRMLKKEDPDIFESDSNDDKCLESIKREIRSLSGLKENSDNSNEAMDKIELLTETKPEQLTTSNEIIQIDADVKCDIDNVNLVQIVEESNATTATATTTTVKEEQTTIEIPDLDEIVEIKDDKSDDGKQETVIIIEETDDANSEETVSDDVKMEVQHSDQKCELDDTTSHNKMDIKERKTSSDDELFEDAKESHDEQMSENQLIADQKSDDNTITIIDTDDDSPAEVNKEDKLGKMKRDYSRKKQDCASGSDKRSDEGTISDDSKTNLSQRMKLKERERSESPYVEEDSAESIPRSRRRYSSTPNIDSLPNSPASSDDREYRAWKKSILIVYNRLSNHKYSSLFLKPISDEQTPEYKTIIYRPMDLQTIKKNIESGLIRTTAEFQRDVMLMCFNAIMYNGRGQSSIRTLAEEMMTDAIHFIDITMDTWKKENEKIGSVTSGSGGSAASTKLMRGRKSPRLPIV